MLGMAGTVGITAHCMMTIACLLMLIIHMIQDMHRSETRITHCTFYAHLLFFHPLNIHDTAWQTKWSHQHGNISLHMILSGC